MDPGEIDSPRYEDVNFARQKSHGGRGGPIRQVQVPKLIGLSLQKPILGSNNNNIIVNKDINDSLGDADSFELQS